VTHAGHDGNELSRIWQSDIIWKRQHLLEGSIASIPIETIERSREMSTDSSHYSSAGPEVEIHRREALRPFGDRKPLAY
jgi:hypothetical protein